MRPRYADVPERVEKRTIADLAEWPYPRNQLVPLTEVVHDRLNVEVFRGCTRGCRFCQAGMITRPVRERPADQVRTMVAEGLRRTGYDEVALTSLSTADFSGIEATVKGIVDNPGCGQVSVSLPSLRVDAFTVGIAGQIQKARRTGLTFAPEAGTWRMRQIINKLIREEDLYSAVDSAFSSGWRRVKLYFLTGLPSETDEDTLGIVDLARNCVDIGRSYTKGASVKASVGGFVPKPFTPFQWFGQNTATELSRKVNLLRDGPAQAKGSSSRGTTPRPRWPRGLASRATGASGRSSSRVAPGRHVPGVERALRRRRCGRTPWPSPGSTSTGTSTATARRTRSSRGTTSPPASTRTSCGRTGRTRWPRSACPTAGGRPATTAGPAPATASSTWWPRPRRRPAAARAPARTSRPGNCRAVELRCASPPAGRSAGMTAPSTAAAPAERAGPRPVPRVRIRFSKFGKVRFTSHRDVARIWERSLRRAGVAMAYTEGFSPRPKLSFGLALSTGHESYGEYLDVALREAPGRSASSDIGVLVRPGLPPGIEVQSAVPASSRAPTRSSRPSPAAPGTSRSAT